MKWIKRIVVGLVIVVVLASAGFVAYTRINRYPALPNPTVLPLLPTGIAPNAWRVFAPSVPTDKGFIFYPGGLVDVDAYAWLGPELAQRGIFTVIVPMPLDLAILNPAEAEKVLKTYPNIKYWAIGGHSLGGAMAGQFLASHTQDTARVHGLVLWGSRLSAGIDVSKLPVNVVSIYGTRDGIAPKDITAEQRRAGLPGSASLVAVDGGNHSMFGDYGLQKGDNPLDIPLDKARKQIVGATLMVFR